MTSERQMQATISLAPQSNRDWFGKHHLSLRSPPSGERKPYLLGVFFLGLLLRLLCNARPDLLNACKTFPDLFIHLQYVCAALGLAVLVPEPQLDSVMLTDELEELVFDIDASLHVSVVVELALTASGKSDPAQDVLETAVGLLNRLVAHQQRLLQLLDTHSCLMLL